MAEQTQAVQDGDIIAPGAAGAAAGTVVASAQLPNLQIEVVHSAAPDGSSERISINLQATPSFEAFGQVLEASNPFALWAQAVQLAWAPLLAANPFLAASPLLPFGAFGALGGMPVCGFPPRRGLKGPEQGNQG
ncbi:hypothetical protein PQJ75_07005 [Rhodoplanes sp. TEM]|uniref:Uncharacterized protein n=1 Tax=Rhodoplanes tepidamans TaxID=200616 RepID=A0ABT5J4W4_RHOTP|nr:MULTISPECIES: hypothetical protein [Rhodoplanes]MDC7784446.1 hypothetical protein [Rhodoplanes tepidamans]MDC7983476.1 hypothetical protein [Rhodoplanes sp. TEM]MDQ0356953.1 hypothetical protein [Rhodoplanes tepidamans]